MAINLRDDSSQLFSDYIEAIVAYRTIMRLTLDALLKHYGPGLLSAHNAASRHCMLDAHDPHFFTHRQAAQYVARHESDRGRDIVRAMRRRLGSDPAMLAFSNALERLGDHALANDLPFFLEHRIRLARTEANVTFVTHADQEAQTAFAHA
jgi:hypothetical protein